MTIIIGWICLMSFLMNVLMLLHPRFKVDFFAALVWGVGLGLLAGTAHLCLLR